jgi:hypothetical protein
MASLRSGRQLSSRRTASLPRLPCLRRAGRQRTDGFGYRLFVGYDAGDGPDRLIAKLPATNSASRFRPERSFELGQHADTINLQVKHRYCS